MAEFDQKLLRKMLDDKLINSDSVKEAAFDPKKAWKSFFNLSKSSVSAGGVTFLPSPGRDNLKGGALKSLQASKLSNKDAVAPEGVRVFNEILAHAKSLKHTIDTRKTLDELAQLQ